MRYIIYIFLFLISFQGFGQNIVKVDSLNVLISSSIDDSTKVKAYNELIWQFMYTNPDTAFTISSAGNKWAAEQKCYFGRAICLTNMGIARYIQGNYEKAIEHYESALKFRKAMDDKRGTANLLNNIGAVYDGQGYYVEAMKFYLQSLKIKEELGNAKDIGATINNMALVVRNEGDFKKALEYFERYLAIFDTVPNSDDNIGVAYNNLGMVNTDLGRFDLALKQLYKANGIFTSLASNKRLVKSHIQLGITWAAQGVNDSALFHYSKAIAYGLMVGDNYGLAGANFRSAEIYLAKGEVKRAINHAKKGLVKAEAISSLEMLKKNHDVLWQAFKLEKNYTLAFYHLENFVMFRDSMFNKENTREIAQRELQYGFDKEQLQDSLQTEENKRIEKMEHNKQMDEQRIYTYAGVALGFLMLVLATILLRGYRMKQKSNLLLAEKNKAIKLQRDIVKEKNQEIMDSIAYAKRIQSAILPPLKVVKEYLQESFILYKPKDVVAGDFYWLEHKDGKIIFAAADCTGHGVPGAMVSVVCNNGLNRSVREHGLSEPGKILDKTREIVIQEFEKSEEEVKDGMDIALCTLDGMKLQYAGAHNPLWIIRNGELIETKANKQPIGQFDNAEPYTTHSFNLESGDTLYIFSDGYVDQFGGEKGKKFKAKAFRELLLSIQEKPMEEQKAIIDESFEIWKGSLEQIDDVCVIGVRI